VPINHKYTVVPPTPLGLENLYCLRISFSEEYLFHNGFSVLLNIIVLEGLGSEVIVKNSEETWCKLGVFF